MLGTRRINVIAGLERPGDDPRELRETFVANLRHAAGEMARAGIQVVMEPINSVDFPGYYFPRCGPAAALVKEVGAENFGLQCDLYHVA